MESKKLQQLQQANSHLAPLQQLPMMPAPPEQFCAGAVGSNSALAAAAADYRPRSPLFPPLGVYPDTKNVTKTIQYSAQDPYERCYDEYDRAPHPHQHPQIQQQHHHHHDDIQQQQQQQHLHRSSHDIQQQLYQSAPRQYRLPQPGPYHGHQHQQVYPQYPQYPAVSPSAALPTTPTSAAPVHRHQQPRLLQEQYRQLQQARTQQRLECQARAALSQQQTFASRQAALQQRELMQSPVPSLMQSPQQQVPQVPPKPAARTMHQQQQQQQGLYVQPHPAHQQQQQPQQHHPQSLPLSHPLTNHNHQQFSHLTSSSIASPLSSPGSPTFASSPSCSSDQQPQHAHAQRSKSISSTTSSTSILLRRPQDGVVAISGWLHKQGCDGLRVWRKRWFVLTEYCLFYYKGLEEEKLLGSVLLPSYKVSLCTPDERQYRRNSFKLEHANMRTYILAAETPEQMAQWVKALQSACTMQGGIGEPDQTSQSQTQSQPSISSLNHSTENSDSGIHTLSSQQQQQLQQSQAQAQVRPAGTQTSPPSAAHNSQQNLLQQPLYANAPPRPRRTNDPGYCSPGPDSIERYEESIYNTRPQMEIARRRQQQQMSHQQQLQQQHQLARSPIPSDAVYEMQQQNHNQQLPYNQQQPQPNNQQQQLYNGPQHRSQHELRSQQLLKQQNQQHLLHHQTLPAARGAKSPDPLQQPPQHLTLPAGYSARNNTAAVVNNTEKQQLQQQYGAGGMTPQQQQFATRDLRSPYEIEVQPPNAYLPENPDNIIRAPRRFQNQDDQYETYLQQQQNHQQPRLQKPNERRTPDTYGRSRHARQQYAAAAAANAAAMPQQPVRSMSSIPAATGQDYEDLYGAEAYRRPMSPTGVSRDLERRGIILPHGYNEQPSSAQVHMRHKPSMQQSASYQKIARPHSADFLEYEAKNQRNQQQQQQNQLQNQQQMSNSRRQAPRPKSSLDIFHAEDQAYYSERGYAEKMRQSALYVGRNQPRNERNQYEGMEMRQRILGGGAGKGQHADGSETSMSSKQHAMHLNDQNGYDEEMHEMSRLTQNREIGNSYSVPRQSKDHMENGSNQFARSASARLFRNNKDQDEPEQGRKVQQREESMKRLLEWKQRMLNAPLVRKPHDREQSPAAAAATVTTPLLMAPPINQQQNSRENQGSATNINRSQRKPPPNNYNSYSSDDEEGRTTETSTIWQAGSTSSHSTNSTQASKTTTITSPYTTTTKKPQSTITIAQAVPPDNQKPKSLLAPKPSAKIDTSLILRPKTPTARLSDDKIVKSSPKEDSAARKSLNINYVPVYSQNRLSKKSKSEFEMKLPLKQNESRLHSAQLTKIKQDLDLSPPKIVSDEQEDEEEGNDEDDKYTDEDLDEILCDDKSEDLKNEENEEECVTPTAQTIEDHYLPMSPRKVSEPTNLVENMKIFASLEVEESPYVEMTQGLDVSTLYRSVSQQDKLDTPYELMTAIGGKLEPVYMELCQLKTGEKNPLSPAQEIKNKAAKKITVKKYHDIKTIKKHNSEYFKTRSELPDILKASHQNPVLSDSSDADDEASRDLDSLDTPCHPRFSLSDTFRPASYYLGVTQNEFPDSSDSEIVSPPPIPKSPPPIEDLDVSLTRDYCSDADRPSGRIEKHKSSRSSLQEPMQANNQRWNRSTADIDYTSLSKYSVDNKLYIEGAVRVRKEIPESDASINDEVELRHRKSSDSSELDVNRLKRRPLSEESVSEITSVNSTFDEAIESVDLDMYLKDLQNNDFMYGKEMYPAPFGWRDGEQSMQPITDEQYYENVEIRIPTSAEQIATPGVFYDSLEEKDEPNSKNLNVVSLRERNLSLHDANCGDKDTADAETDLRSSLSHLDLQQATPLHSRNNSNISEQSAPYYYSDIASRLSSNQDVSLPLPEKARLNNSGRSDASSKKSIAQIQNPLNQLSFDEQRLQPHSHFVQEARSVSVEFLNSTSKSDGIDERNLYESDTLKRLKATDQSPTNIDTKNIYPGNVLHHDKTSPKCSAVTHDGQANSGFHLHSEDSFQTSSSIVDMLLQSAGREALLQSQNEGDVPWEEDAIWRESLRRESLRRVSVRHARSLDDLDGIMNDSRLRQTTAACNESWGVVDSIARTERRQEKQRTRPRLQRGATYVNDNQNLTPNRRSSRGERTRSSSTSGVQEDEYVRLAVNQGDDGVYETLQQRQVATKTFDYVDREKLRQWDWMSSGLVKNDLGGNNQASGSGCFTESMIGLTDSESSRRETNGSVAGGIASIKLLSESSRGKDEPSDGILEASGSVSIPRHPPIPAMSKHPSRDTLNSTNTKNNLPIRAVSPRVRMSPDTFNENNRQDFYNQQQPQNDYVTKNYKQEGFYKTGNSVSDRNLKNSSYNYNEEFLINNRNNTDMIYDKFPKKNAEEDCVIERDPNYAMHENEQSEDYILRRQQNWPVRRVASQIDDLNFIDRDQVNRQLNVSAGDLLGRTHEELVLLLIQLRRQNTATARAIEQCCSKIHQLQSRLGTTDAAQRMEHLQRLDMLKQHLLDLEKQYEKSKPLVNLVDNMVKLGALYRVKPNASNGVDLQSPLETATLDRLEFNQRIQERRLMKEEQKHWDRPDPSEQEFQSKVKQLYQQDALLQEESNTLQGLQRDKESLERALNGLRSRIQSGPRDPEVMEKARRQQQTLEDELSRVHSLLAHNSKKLEQTVAGNARLEQELMVLRQKLQESKSTRGSQQISNQGAPDSVPYAGGATALLESELRRVQQVVGDLQQQRQELSQAVRQLTDKSQCLVQDAQPKQPLTTNASIKKRPQATWLETDLDLMVTLEHGIDFSESSQNLSQNHRERSSSSSGIITPLYIDTNGRDFGTDDDKTTQDDLESDTDTNIFGGLNSVQDKPEIKTVRIVKRESERRQRDRNERTSVPASWGQPAQNLDNVIEEEINRQQSQLEDNQYQRNNTSLPRNLQNNSLSQSSPMLSPNQNMNGGLYTPQNNYYNQNQNQSYRSSLLTNPMLYDNRNLYLPTMNYMEDYTRGLKDVPKSESVMSLSQNIELSPVFQSEAAKEIISNISVSSGQKKPTQNGKEYDPTAAQMHKRQVPKEKRRHYTAPQQINSKSLLNIQSESDFNKEAYYRARDDLDMERALRSGRSDNAPDLVRSTMDQDLDLDLDQQPDHIPRHAKSSVLKDPRYSETTIDKLLAAPSKILIPERYVPEQAPELSPEELERRQQKAESIRKMLSTTSLGPANTNTQEGQVPTDEKRQREHLLQLNQILAKQVMEMSKIVAAKAMANLPQKTDSSLDEDDHSPLTPLPIYQQRDNYFT